MTELEAIKTRHSVRKYLDKPIDISAGAVLRAEIERINAENGLHIQLVLDEPKAFASGILKYGAFSGVRNYLVMAGKKSDEEMIGYYGEKLVLLAQTLNTLSGAKTIGRANNSCGQTGVIIIAFISGSVTGPPADIE